MLYCNYIKLQFIYKGKPDKNNNNNNNKTKSKVQKSFIYTLEQ